MVLYRRSVQMWNRCNVIIGELERGTFTALHANIAVYHVLKW